MSRGGAENVWHLAEMSAAEFSELLHRHFPEVEVYGQRVVYGSLTWPLNGSPLRARVRPRQPSVRPVPARGSLDSHLPRGPRIREAGAESRARHVRIGAVRESFGLVARRHRRP